MICECSGNGLLQRLTIDCTHNGHRMDSLAGISHDLWNGGYGMQYRTRLIRKYRLTVLAHTTMNCRLRRGRR